MRPSIFDSRNDSLARVVPAAVLATNLITWRPLLAHLRMGETGQPLRSIAKSPSDPRLLVRD